MSPSSRPGSSQTPLWLELEPWLELPGDPAERV